MAAWKRRRRRLAPGADIAQDVIDLLRPYLGDPIGPLSDSARGRQAKYRCPFHKGGHERKPSFYTNVDNGISYCHTCHEWWWLRRLLHLMGARRNDQKLADMLTEDTRPAPDRRRARREKQPPAILPEELLGVFHWCPTSLVDKGFSRSTLQYYEVGFDKANGRITYPLRDMQGNLLGVSGGSKSRYPKYLNYGPDQLKPFLPDGPVPGRAPELSLMLWNGHRVWAEAFHGDYDGPIIIVEGFKAAMWVAQAGYPVVVALFGSYLSEYQRDLLVHFSNRLVLFLDLDDSGVEGAHHAYWSLRKEKADVVTALYPASDDDLQPDDLSPDNVVNAIQRGRRTPCLEPGQD